MISTQPIFSVRYFQLKKNFTPKGLKKLFYLSWEDALWDLLNNKKIKKGSYILVPDFFCGDVENNIKKHGYKIARYHVDSDLIPSKKSLMDEMANCSPGAIIIFHSVGMQNALLNKNIAGKITENTLLIEDCVHKIVNPSKIKILKKNHFIIDSLRKVLPLQGSRLIGRTVDLNFNVPGYKQSLYYSIKVHFYWLLMLLMWHIGDSKKAEKLMTVGYDLIGDSLKPARGFAFFELLSEHLNYRKIEECKTTQAVFYEKNLKVRPIYKEKDRKNLRGWPVVINKNADKVLKKLRDAGLTVRFELNDSLWSRKRKIVYLPMGFQLTSKIQTKICEIFNESISV